MTARAGVRKRTYVSRGMQIICCSAKMAFMGCWTVSSGSRGGTCAAPSCSTSKGMISQHHSRSYSKKKTPFVSPDFTACKHARVHHVGADQGGFGAVEALRQQLVRRRLVETDGSRFTGAVMLVEAESVASLERPLLPVWGLLSSSDSRVLPPGTQVLRSPEALAMVTM